MSESERNLRDPHYEFWYWDSLNREVQEVIGRPRWRMSDIDGAGQIRGKWRHRGRVLLAEGSSNPEKPDDGQVEMMKDLSLRAGITVVSFVGDYPEPPAWVARLARHWADGSLPAEGYWTEDRYKAHGGHA